MPLLMGKCLGARKGSAACLLPRHCLGFLFETDFLLHKHKLMDSLSILIWSMMGYLLIQMFIYLCKMKFGSRILTQWKGLNWGLKQLSVLFLMAHLILEKLIWRRNPNCTRFLKVSPNLTLFWPYSLVYRVLSFFCLSTRLTSTASFFKVDRT